MVYCNKFQLRSRYISSSYCRRKHFRWYLAQIRLWETINNKIHWGFTDTTSHIQVSSSDSSTGLFRRPDALPITQSIAVQWHQSGNVHKPVSSFLDPSLSSPNKIFTAYNTVYCSTIHTL